MDLISPIGDNIPNWVYYGPEELTQVIVMYGLTADQEIQGDKACD